MRLSLDSRRGKSAGTTAVPYLVVTTRVASPFVLAGASVSTLSTGAQSRPWQHSIGYHSCAMAGDCMASASAIANSVEDVRLHIRSKRERAPAVPCICVTVDTPSMSSLSGRLGRLRARVAVCGGGCKRAPRSSLKGRSLDRRCTAIRRTRPRFETGIGDGSWAEPRGDEERERVGCDRSLPRQRLACHCRGSHPSRRQVDGSGRLLAHQPLGALVAMGAPIATFNVRAEPGAALVPSARAAFLRKRSGRL